MEIEFYKYHGAGNDFIIIDNRSLTFNKTNPQFIAQLCNRRFGIGADGLILLENDSETDFRMIYINANGYESTMCGNGGRCIVAFAFQQKIIKSNTIFKAIDGIHKADIDSNFNVNLEMADVDSIEEIKNDFVLNTGSPHYVRIINQFSDNFVEEARTIRNSKRFVEEGINVNFIKVDNNNIEIRTFERGVEDETLACGTGCVASALSIMHNNNSINKIYLKAKGGNLEVKATKTNKGFTDIWLYGPSSFVFKGNINQ